MRSASIVILTGAGLSAESGVSTFRDPNGIWAKYDYRDVATPEGFARDPGTVHAFYNMRRRAHQDVKPNAAHLALARLEAAHPGVTIVTQNVDALHEAACSTSLIHMHGEILKALCATCGARQPWHGDMDATMSCPACDGAGHLRPDVVWFGETPYHMERIAQLLAGAICSSRSARAAMSTLRPASCAKPGSMALIPLNSILNPRKAPAISMKPFTDPRRSSCPLSSTAS
jgi:NAD-dependent deacetylase